MNSYWNRVCLETTVLGPNFWEFLANWMTKERCSRTPAQSPLALKFPRSSLLTICTHSHLPEFILVITPSIYAVTFHLTRVWSCWCILYYLPVIIKPSSVFRYQSSVICLVPLNIRSHLSFLQVSKMNCYHPAIISANDLTTHLLTCSPHLPLQ